MSQRRNAGALKNLERVLGQSPEPPRPETPLERMERALRDSPAPSATTAPRTGSGPSGGPSGPSGTDLAKTIGLHALDAFVMKPLETLAAPGRAVVSTSRELVDLLDSDTKTRASFRDWYRQASDPAYGFGTAFPMQGNFGRFVGFAGDVLLDPLTYVTFGGTVPLKMVGKAAVQGSIRKLGAKSVIGREGRQKLATHVDRLLRDRGTDLAQRKEIVTRVAAQGKSALYDDAVGREMLEELGVAGPGLYYFGSRFKIPGSDAIGAMMEKGVTKARLGVSTSKPFSAALRAMTPAGVGRLSDFGPDAIRNIRNAAATGQDTVRIGSPEVGFTTIDTYLGLKILEWDDLRRGALAGATQNWENPAIGLIQRIKAWEQITGRQLSDFIDGAGHAGKNILDNTDQLPQGAREELVAIAGEWKVLTDRIYDDVVAEAAGTGRDIGYIKEGYFPRRKTEEFAEWLEANRGKGLDDILEEEAVSGPTRYANNLRFRALKEGSIWFGHPLGKGDLTAERLNFYMMNPTPKALETMAERGIDLPVGAAFITDTSDALIMYMRDMAEQVGTFRMAKAIGRDPEYGRILDELPATPDGQAVISREIAEAAGVYREALQRFNQETVRLVNGLHSALHHASGDIRTTLATLRQDLLTPEAVDDVAETVAELLDDMTSQADSLRAAREAIEHYAPRNDAGEITGNYKNVASAADALEERFGRLSQSVRDALTAVGEDPDGGARLSNAIDELLEYYQEAAAFHRQNVAWSSIGNVLPAIDSMDELSPSALYSVILDYSRSSRAAAPDVLGMSDVAASRRRIDSPLVVYKRTSKGSVLEHRPGKPYPTRRRLNSRQAAEQDAWSRRDALLTKQYRRIGQAVARAKARIKNPNQARETISEVYAKAFNGEDLTAEQAESIHDVFMYTLGRLHDVAIVNHQAVVYAGNRTSARALKTVADSFAEFLAAISKRGPDDAVDMSFFRLDGYPPEVQKLFYAFRETAAARNSKGGKISAEALHTIQDALHFSSSYEQYWEMTRWMDPFGVVIGDDVIDQILAHNARGYALDAARAGNLERFDRVTSPGYGRRDDTGIFGNYFQVLVERQNLSEVMDELSYLNIGKGETVYTPPPGLTPVERARYKDEAEMLEALIRSTWEQTQVAYALATRADIRYEKLVDARAGTKSALLDAIYRSIYKGDASSGSWDADWAMSQIEYVFRQAFRNMDNVAATEGVAQRTFDEFWQQASGQMREDIALMRVLRDTFADSDMLDTSFDEFGPAINALLLDGVNPAVLSGNPTPRELHNALAIGLRQRILDSYDRWWDYYLNEARAIYLTRQEDALVAARKHTDARNRISELTAQAKRSAERGVVMEDTLLFPPADVQSNPRLKSLHDALDYMQGQDDLYPFYKSQQNHVQALLALSAIQLPAGQTFLGMSQSQIDNFIADAIAGKTVRMPQVVREAAESGKSFQDYVRASVDEYLASPAAAGGLRDPAEHYKMVKQLNRSFGQSEAGKYLARMNAIRGEIIKIVSESRRGAPSNNVDSAMSAVRRNIETNEQELAMLRRADRRNAAEVAQRKSQIVELLARIERTRQLTDAVQAGDDIPRELAQELFVQRELRRIVDERRAAGQQFYSVDDIPQSEIDAVRSKIQVDTVLESEFPLESMYPGLAFPGSASRRRGSQETEAFGRIYWDFKRNVDTVVRTRAKQDFMEEVFRGDEYIAAYNDARVALDRQLYDKPLSEKGYREIVEEIEALKKLHEVQADTPQTLSQGGYRRAVREREKELRRRRPEPEDSVPEPVSAVPGDYTSYPLRSLVFEETGDLPPWVLADIRAGRTIRIKFELLEDDSGRLFSLFWRALKEQGYENVKVPPGSDAFGVRVFAPAQADTLRPTTRRFDADLSKGGRQEQFVPDEADAMDLVGSQYSGRESFPLRYEYVVGHSDDGQPILRSKVFYVNPFDLEDAAPGSALAKLVDDPGGFEGMTRAEKLEILQAIESRENIPRYFETTEPRNVPRSDVETPRPSGVVPARTTRTPGSGAPSASAAAVPEPAPASARVSINSGHSPKGRGTPDGDGKDKAMRAVADSSITELDSESVVFLKMPGLETSTYTTKRILGPVRPDSRVVMLARNGSLRGRPLRNETVEAVRRAHAQGVRFVVGDMPGVDEPFVRLLDEIGAEYTVYSAGRPRFAVRETAEPTPRATTRLPMVYSDGTNGMRMRPEYSGSSTLELIKSGVRTSTTRGLSKQQLDALVPGARVTFFSGNDSVDVIITATPSRIVRPANAEAFREAAEAWSKAEGWMPEHFEQYIGKYQIRYRLADDTAQPTPRATQPDPEDFVDPNDIPMDDGWTYEVVDEIVDIPIAQADIAFDQATNAQREITEQRIRDLQQQLETLNDLRALSRTVPTDPESRRLWRQPFLDHIEAAQRFLGELGENTDELDRLFMSFLESETAYLQAVDRLGPEAFHALQIGRLDDYMATLNDPATDPFVQALEQIGPGWAQLNETYFPNIAVTADLKSLWTKADYRRDPEYLRNLKKYLGEATKFHKAYAVATPGFHIRNSIANAFNLFILGVNFKNALEAEKIYRRWQVALRDGITWDEFSRTVPAEQLENINIAYEATLRSGGGIFSAAYKEAVGGNKLYDNKLTRWNYALGQRADDSVRFALAYDTAVKGGNADAAQVLIKRFFFDYEDLSQVDKFLKEFIPFWLWTSRNLYSQMQNMWLNPKRYVQYQHLKRNLRDDDERELASKNQFVKELGGFKLPFGSNMYLVPDLGFARATQTPLEYADWPRTLNPFTPAVKLPAELLMNKTAFTGKPVRKDGDAAQQSLDVLAHILRGGFAPANQAGRMFADGDDAINLNAVLSFLGSPVRKYDN